MCMYMYVYIYIYTCVCVSILSLYLSISIPIYLHLSVLPSVSLPICRSIYLVFYLSNQIQGKLTKANPIYLYAIFRNFEICM